MSNSKSVKIEIQKLSKVFGPRAKKMLPFIEQGINRPQMLAEHNHVLALKNINMSLHSGSIEVIMGLSGSGKSTLIRHINRLIEPTSGKLIVDGIDVCELDKKDLRDYRQQKTAMVFQHFALLPHRNIIDNIAFGLQMQKRPEKHIKDSCYYWLERVGLKGFEFKYPAQLSGGMQQRVGLARALACDADILMLDEAFSALDPLIRSDMQDMLLSLQSELNKTIVFITHDLEEALKIGDRIAILNQGELIQQGDAENILMHPVDDYVRRFVAGVGRANILKAKGVMSSVSNVENMERSVSVKLEDSLSHILNKVLTADAQCALVKNEDNELVGYIDAVTLAEVVNQ